MKRYISLALAAVVLVVSLAVPSFAAETVWLDILDSYTVNDSGINFAEISDNDILNFPVPYSRYQYIDIVVEFSNMYGTVPVVDVYRTNDYINTLTSVKLYDNIYRFYGNIDGWYNRGISLKFSNIGHTGVTFLSARTTNLSVSSFNLPVSGFFSYGAGEEVDFYYNNEDDYSGAILYGSSNFDYDDYRGYLQFNEAVKYDFIDVHFYLSQLSLVSLSATLDGLTVPYEVSYLTADSAFENSFITVTLDLTSINRNTTSPLELILTGSVSALDNRVGSFTVLSSNGLLDVNYGTPLLNFWYRLKDFLGTSFTSIISSISSSSSNIVSTLSSFSSSVSSLFSTWFGNLETWFSNLYSDLESFFAFWFNAFYSQVNSIIQYFINLINALEIWFFDLFDSIDTWGQNIVDAINGDASDADDFKQQVDDSNRELNDMAAVMDSFTTPDVNSINVDVGSYISPTDLSSLTAPMGMLFESNIVTTCIMISIIMGTVMFVLYGKR